METSTPKRLLRRLLPNGWYRAGKSIYWSGPANGVRRAVASAHAFAYSGRFDRVETLLLFIGYPRSGHSLVGSLLNAHPEIVVAHELHALWYFDRGFNPSQVFSMIDRRDRWFGRIGRRWTEFNYQVPGQWQGRTRRPRILGDKKGDGVTDLTHIRPGLLERLINADNPRIKVIHTVRNPYDNVATMSRRTGDNLVDCIERHRNRSAVNQSIVDRYGPERVFSARHEELIANPRTVLSDMCRFLGMDASDSYLESCASILYPQPNRSRHTVGWTDADRASVERIIRRTPFLAGYRFHEG